MITVFTPTYNRAYILQSLYQSLQKQTSRDFEWLIVDDGSTDNSRILIENWIKEDIIRIRYLYQNNGGKHRAINYGAKEAHGELFFIVDSDDSLSENAIERIENYYKGIKDNPLFAGVYGLRCFPNGSRIGGECDFKILDCNSLDFRYKYKIKGDMAEVLRTEVIRQYPFPEFDGEKFCPISYVILK